MSDLTELQAMATREQQARKPICLRCCMAAGCLSSGAEPLKEQLEAAVKQAGVQDLVEVRAVGCLRLCSRGPLLQADPSGTYYCHVTPDHAPALIAALTNGQIDAAQLAAMPESIDPQHPFFAGQVPVVLEQSGQIDPERIESALSGAARRHPGRCDRNPDAQRVARARWSRVSDRAQVGDGGEGRGNPQVCGV
ncbi:MAG TPA: (2Fe-2S) ferredoxin domain-containing protein [Roseiflexaceae bacterium]|nr:(2Fe-2S) ferredoxin domain-containing protein [Roseiflexaceae bacterium]